MGNWRGSYRSTHQNTMRAFDRLPRDIRRALAEAAVDWAVQPFRTRYERGGPGNWSRDIVRDIRRWDGDFVRKSDAERGLTSRKRK